MSLVRLRRWRWRCPPTIAARHVVQVAWVTPLQYEAEEIDLDDPDFKRLRISVPKRKILEVHCQLDGDSDTAVEAFQPSDLPARFVALASRFLDEVERRAIEKRFPRGPMGFQP